MEWISNDELKRLSQEAKRTIDEICGYASQSLRGGVDGDMLTGDLDEILGKYRDFEYQRTEILNRYAAERKTIRESELADETKDLLLKKSNSAKNSEIYMLIDDLTRSSTSLGDLFESMRYKSVSEIETVIAKGEELYDFFSAPNYDYEKGAALGVSADEFAQLGDNPAVLTKIRERLSSLTDLTEKSSDGFLGMAKAWETVTKGFESGNSKDIESGLRQINNRVSAISSIFSDFQSTMSDLSDMTGSDFFSELADGLADVGNAVSSTLSGAFAGSALGPAGTIAGGIAGFLSSVVSIINESTSIAQQLSDYYKNTTFNTYFGELEVNKLWRERYEWAQRIGESTLDYSTRKGAELEAQISANETAQQSLMDRLMKESFDDGLVVKHSFWTGFDLATKWSTLAGKSWEEIERLATSGKLSKEAMLYYEAVKDAREEGEDLEKLQLEYLEDMREMVTGSTYDSIVGGIVNGFNDGLRSAEDFANSFDKLMEKALSSALSVMADEKMRDWYEDFALMGEDGYTQEEIALAKKQYIEYLKALEEDAKNLELVTGQEIGSGGESDSRRGSSTGIATASQDSVDENNGRLTAIQGHTYSINRNVGAIASLTASMRESIFLLQSNSTSQLIALQGIRQNTEPIAAMQSDMVRVKTTLNDIQMKGVRIIV